VVSFLSLSLSSFFSQSNKKKNVHTQLFFPSFRLMNSELLTLPSSHASAAMIILITHSTNEKNKKKNGRSLGLGLASSPLLYKEMKRQRKGNEGIRQEEKKKSPHQHAQNPRADAFMSLFSILSLSLADTTIQ
jgi:hypothetical protein